MANPQNPNAGPPPRGSSSFTPGLLALHIVIVFLLMSSSAVAFVMSPILGIRARIIGGIATGISIFLVVYLSTTPVHADIHDAISLAIASKLNAWYMVLVNVPQVTRESVLFIFIYIFILSLFIPIFYFSYFTRSSVQTSCDSTLNLLARQSSETTGLSTGCIVFDTQRPDGNLKMQAANSFKQGDIKNGIKTLAKAHQWDSSDGETLIYQEDQKVLATHTPFISIVIPTILTGTYAYMGRDDLQGIVPVQQAFNESNNAMKLVVVIANIGSSPDAAVTKLIVNAAKYHSSVIGIIGPPQCSQTKAIMDALNASKAELPVISPDVSCDDLTNYSPYLFQIAPANSLLTQIAAFYIKEILHVVHIVIFTNLADTEDTNNQADDIKKSFAIPPVIEPYEPGDVQQIKARILDMEQLQSVPGAIYFSGSSNDLSTLLANLPATGPFAHVPVVGLDPLYSLGGYNQSNQQMRANFQRLKLVSLFFPDEATFLKEKPPAFLDEYTTLFDPNHTHPGGIYGFSRMDTRWRYPMTPPTSSLMLYQRLAHLLQKKISWQG